MQLKQILILGLSLICGALLLGFYYIFEINKEIKQMENDLQISKQTKQLKQLEEQTQNE